MKLLLIGTHPDNTTGYSKVVHNILEELAPIPNLKVYHFAFQRHTSSPGIRKHPKNVSAYDVIQKVDVMKDSFGITLYPKYLELVKPDVILMYNDATICHMFLEETKKINTTAKVWIYLDQLYWGINPSLITSLNRADRIYGFTEEWSAIWKSYDKTATNDIKTLHHAVDREMFHPITDEVRKETRERLGYSDTDLVILNLNRNSARKRHDLAIMGFVQHLKRNPTSPLHMLIVTGMSAEHGSHFDILRIFHIELSSVGLSQETFKDRIKVINTAPPNRLSDEDINNLYHSTDIGINTSDGEGYGLCPLEHLFTGSPQILTDIGVYRSFINEDAVEYIPPFERQYFGGAMMLGAFMPTFRIGDVATAMDTMVEKYAEKKLAATIHEFRTWKEVLKPLVEDIQNGITILNDKS
jgi:glycosyltransferase involved in cell wall biosynthesis